MFLAIEDWFSKYTFLYSQGGKKSHNIENLLENQVVSFLMSSNNYDNVPQFPQFISKRFQNLFKKYEIPFYKTIGTVVTRSYVNDRNEWG